MHVVVDKHHGRIGFGIVVRDYEGVILAACSTTRNVVAESVVAETLTALHAVELCKEMSFNDIILEGDAL
jgi:ribonuclease HI